MIRTEMSVNARMSSAGKASGTIRVGMSANARMPRSAALTHAARYDGNTTMASMIRRRSMTWPSCARCWRSHRAAGQGRDGADRYAERLHVGSLGCRIRRGTVSADTKPPLLGTARDERFATAIKQAIACADGSTTLKDTKPALRAALTAARETGDADPVAQAAARAISTACGVIQTPTNALGFAF